MALALIVSPPAVVPGIPAPVLPSFAYWPWSCAGSGCQAQMAGDCTAPADFWQGCVWALQNCAVPLAMADCTMAQLAAGTEMSFMLISLGMDCSSRHDLFYVRHSSVPCCKPRWQLVLYVYVARLICVCVCDCVGAAPQVLPNWRSFSSAKAPGSGVRPRSGVRRGLPDDERQCNDTVKATGWSPAGPRAKGENHLLEPVVRLPD